MKWTGQKLPKLDMNDIRPIFHFYILIPRKCPRKTLFQHTVPPFPSGFSEHSTALNLLMLMAPSSTSFLNNESARLLRDKRHSKVGTRPEAFHNVCQKLVLFSTLLKPNKASNMNRTRKCLINLIIHSMWILLFAFWQNFRYLKKGYQTSHILKLFLQFFFIQNVMYNLASVRLWNFKDGGS